MKKSLFTKAVMAIALSLGAMNASAGLVQINGTLTSCVGICSILSAIGNDVTATVFIPGADGSYTGGDLNGLHTPNIEIEGTSTTLEFIGEVYAEAGLTAFPPLPPAGPFLGSAGPLPTAPGGATALTVTGGAAGGVVSVAGLGSTTGLPVWGIFDFDTGLFESYLFSADADPGTPGDQPGHVLLAAGTFTASAVPVPAAAWLMGSALLGLLGVRRVQRA